MTQTFTTRFSAFVLAAAVVFAAWLPTVTVPLTADNTAIVAAVA
jgi:hypothetical protein